MNFKSILSVTVLFVVCTSSHYVNGLLHMPREIADKCDLTAKPQCSGDCTKILVCAAHIETPVLSVNCTGNTPYCDKGHCVASPGECTEKSLEVEVEAEFLCTSSGVFPDPTDCRKSHFCSELGSQSVMSLCPRGHIFDSKTKICALEPIINSKSICQTISCDGLNNHFVTFAPNPAFYAYCFTSAAGVQHTYMYKCDDEDNKMFDVRAKKCRFNCKSIGYYADPMDCSSYYICNGMKFAFRRVRCPPNYYFNGTVCLNSKAHCPAGSIIDSSTAESTSTAESSTADEGTTIKSTTILDSSLADDVTSTSIGDNSLTDEVTSTSTPILDSSSADEVTSTSTSIVDSSSAGEVTSTSTSIVDSSSADEVTSTSTSIVDSSSADEVTSTSTHITDSSSADEVTSTSTSTPFVDSSLADDVTSTSTQISDNSLAVEATSTSTSITDTSLPDKMSTTFKPTPAVEVTTSESSTTKTSTTHKPATDGSQTYLTTKRPSIWKHMGLISVRVSKSLNNV